MLQRLRALIGLLALVESVWFLLYQLYLVNYVAHKLIQSNSYRDPHHGTRNTREAYLDDAQDCPV